MIKNLVELKQKYGKNLENVNDINDLKDLTSNFLRMVTWKKLKDMEVFENKHIALYSYIIKDIKNKGFNQALKDIKYGNLHKAYNIKHVYAYYNLELKTTKQLKKERLDIYE